MSILLVFGIVVLAAVVWIQVVVRAIRRFFHFPIPAFAVRAIDNPLRRWVQPPQVVVGWMGIREGMCVVEVGPGSGTFTVEAGRRVGGGKVYAVDIQPEVVAVLEKRLKKEGIENVVATVASAYELPFPDGVVDRVFMVAVLAEIPDRGRALREIKRVLKDDGVLCIGEFVVDPDYPRKKTVVAWCEREGFALFDVKGGILHYLVLFRKSG